MCRDPQAFAYLAPISRNKAAILEVLAALCLKIVEHIILSMLVLRYFQCEPKYGLFAPAHKVKKIADAPAASSAPSQGQSDSPAAPAVAEEKTSKDEVIVSCNI